MNDHRYTTGVAYTFPLTNTHRKTVAVSLRGTKNVWHCVPFTTERGKPVFRFMAEKPGMYSFTDGSLKKTIEVMPYSGTNALYLHGGVVFNSKKQAFTYGDGTAFFYLADTWWYGATKRMPFDTAFKTLVKTRKKQGFSVVYLVVGIPPEIAVDSTQAESEGGMPFTREGTINQSYFNMVDRKIAYLVDNGLVPCIVGSWGNHIDELGVACMKLLWQEICARYASYPVMFCLTGEVDKRVHQKELHFLKNSVKSLMPKSAWLGARRVYGTVTTLFKKQVNDSYLTARIAAWDRVGQALVKQNAYKRPLFVHTSGHKTAFELFGKKRSYLVINTFQSGHSRESMKAMIQIIEQNVKVGTPILNMEPWYEGIGGNFGPEYQRLAFWASMLGGAVGHSYGAHGIWQMEEKDNFMGHWGRSSWKRASHFKGADDIGRAAYFLRKHDMYRLNPIKAVVSDTYCFFEGKSNHNDRIIYVSNASKYDINSMNVPKGHTAYILDPSTMKVGRKKVYTTNDMIVVITSRLI